MGWAVEGGLEEPGPDGLYGDELPGWEDDPDDFEERSEVRIPRLFTHRGLCQRSSRTGQSSAFGRGGAISISVGRCWLSEPVYHENEVEQGLEI